MWLWEVLGWLLVAWVALPLVFLSVVFAASIAIGLADAAWSLVRSLWRMIA